MKLEGRITDKQLKYIECLSNYNDTKKLDKKDIDDFLDNVGKWSIYELTKQEGYELIDILRERKVEYVFPCGKKSLVSKDDHYKFYVSGALESCLYCCPDDIDINDCGYLHGHGRLKSD